MLRPGQHSPSTTGASIRKVVFGEEKNKQKNKKTKTKKLSTKTKTGSQPNVPAVKRGVKDHISSRNTFVRKKKKKDLGSQKPKPAFFKDVTLHLYPWT